VEKLALENLNQRLHTHFTSSVMDRYTELIINISTMPQHYNIDVIFNKR